MQGKNIVLGVSGGISAYKAIEVMRRLTERGMNVRVVMTEAAKQFVTPLTFRELSYYHVATDMFEEPKGPLMQHLDWVEWADLVLVAPATANVINKMAAGIADNLLTTMLLSAASPILLAPAMDSDMFTNPITQHNIERLRELGIFFVGPESGPLARRNIGPGRLSEPEHIVERVVQLLASGEKGRRGEDDALYDLRGIRFLITAGPTHEAIDPVRFIGNRSSGKMGYALARAAVNRGADVMLVSGPTALETPYGVDRVDVTTAQQMYDAVLKALPNADVIIKAAAVADYRIREIAAEKIKKDATGDALALELVRNPDIAATVGKTKRDDQILVAFAAETSHVIEHAKKKVQSKGANLMVANNVAEEGSGFAVDTNKVSLVYKSGEVQELPLLAKQTAADKILDAVKQLRSD